LHFQNVHAPLRTAAPEAAMCYAAGYSISAGKSPAYYTSAGEYCSPLIGWKIVNFYRIPIKPSQNDKKNASATRPRRPHLNILIRCRDILKYIFEFFNFLHFSRK
jgi:hypothetical protein